MSQYFGRFVFDGYMSKDWLLWLRAMTRRGWTKTCKSLIGHWLRMITRKLVKSIKRDSSKDQPSLFLMIYGMKNEQSVQFETWILLLTLNKASLSHHSGYYEYTLLSAVASILFSRVLILHVRIVKISILIEWIFVLFLHYCIESVISKINLVDNLCHNHNL